MKEKRYRWTYFEENKKTGVRFEEKKYINISGIRYYKFAEDLHKGNYRKMRYNTCTE